MKKDLPFDAKYAALGLTVIVIAFVVLGFGPRLTRKVWARLTG